MVCLLSVPIDSSSNGEGGRTPFVQAWVTIWSNFLLTTCPTDQSGYGEGFYGLELGKFRHSGNALANLSICRKLHNQHFRFLRKPTGFPWREYHMNGSNGYLQQV